MESAGGTAEAHPFLDKINALCALFAERAAQVDRGGPANDLFRGNIAMLAEIGFYGASIPEQYGGLGLPEQLQRECVERISAACGVTAFAQNQLHTAGAFVKGASEELKRELLPALCSGMNLCGVAFSHLRRAGGSPVTARRASGGFLVSGRVPWISDWSILTSFVLGAAVEQTGELLYCYVNRNTSAGHLVASPPMQLAVMTAADTVGLTIEDLFVSEQFVLRRHAAEQLKQGDLKNITLHVSLPLGCARGSAMFLSNLNRPLAQQASIRLKAEIDGIRADSEYWTGARIDEPDYLTHALRARSSAVSVALRAAEAAIAASGGSAHLVTHPAQRRLREAGFYETMALTSETQAALMETFTHE